MDEAIRGTDQITAGIGPATLEGLTAGVNAILEQARSNFYDSPAEWGINLMDIEAVWNIKKRKYERTGTLGASLQILSYDSNGKSHTIAFGSNLTYPFYQEYGYTSRGGRFIPGKFFLMRAVEMTRPRFNELMLSKIVTAIPWRVTT
jgi:hypothetical protein